MLTSLLKKGLTTLGLCALSASAYAQVTGYNVSVECNPFIPGEESQIAICITNPVTIMGVQSNIIFPDGITVQTDRRGGPVLYDTDRTEGFSIDGSTASGVLIVTCYSGKGYEIYDNEGPVFIVAVDVSEDFAGGTLKLENVRVSATIDEDTSNTESVTLGDYSFELEAVSTVIDVESISITYNGEDVETVEMTEGDEYTFTATVSPENATESIVVWTIADAVEDEGVEGQEDNAATVASIAVGTENLNEVTITALTQGTAILTATAGEITKTVSITVVKAVVPVSEITITPSEAQEITEGDSMDFIATVAPNDATVNTVTWLISNPDLATIAVDQENPNKVTVVAVAAGKVTLTATADDGSDVKAEMTITIVEKVIDVTSIKITYDGELTIIPGATVQLTAEVTPENATNTEVTWSSSDDSIATVSQEGLVTGVVDGKATITATSVQNSEVAATIQVTVDNSSGVNTLTADAEGYYNVYNTKGQFVIKTTDFSKILNLATGIYVVNGFKVAVK